MRERSTSKPEAGLLRFRPHVVEFVRFRIDAPDRADAGSNVVAEQLPDQIGEALVPGGENDEIEGPAGAALQPDAIRLESLDILILDQSHFAGDQKIRAARSEEHTSELQSLMRNSYAVFCLKTKRIPAADKDHKHRIQH